MEVPLTIGRNSSAEKYFIDLADLPNLFISYHEEEQLTSIFKSLITDLLKIEPPVQLAISFGRKLAKNLEPLIYDTKIRLMFTHSDPEDNKINTIDEFISSLQLQLKDRRRLKAKTKNKNQNPYLLVFIDNIFEVIMSSRKKTGMAFIEVLMNGPSESIHCIAGASGIYKNLISQLIHISPALKRKLNGSNQTLKIDEPLAAELIINPDGLIFFRNRNENMFIRLFPN